MYGIGVHHFNRAETGNYAPVVRDSLKAISRLESSFGKKFTRVGVERVPEGNEPPAVLGNLTSRYFLALKSSLEKREIEPVQIDNRTLTYFQWFLERLIKRTKLMSHVVESKDFMILKSQNVSIFQLRTVDSLKNSVRDFDEEKFKSVLDKFRERYPVINLSQLRALREGVVYLRSLEMHDTAVKQGLNLIIAYNKQIGILEAHHGISAFYITGSNGLSHDFHDNVETRRKAYEKHQKFLEEIRRLASN